MRVLYALSHTSTKAIPVSAAAFADKTAEIADEAAEITPVSQKEEIQTL